jgi:non-homologous end joining protein Ku
MPKSAMPRTLWKGAISFGLVNIPVGLYSAENRNSFDLDLLDKRTLTPVGFKRYKSQNGNLNFERCPYDIVPATAVCCAWRHS